MPEIKPIWELQGARTEGKAKLCWLRTCSKPHLAKGLCKYHYYRARAGCLNPDTGEPVKNVTDSQADDILFTQLFGDPSEWIYLVGEQVLLRKETGQEVRYWAAQNAYGAKIRELVQTGAIQHYARRTFQPIGPVPERFYNTYRELPSLTPDDFHEPLAEENEILLSNLGGKHTEYLKDWLGWGFRNLGEGSCALVLHGVPGAGKGVLQTLLKEIYGPYLEAVNAWTLENGFNAWIEKALLVVADEIAVRSFREREKIKHVLKTYVMPGGIQINRKGVDQYTANNWSRWLIYSNDTHPVDIEVVDRRYSVIRSFKPLDPMLGHLIVEEKRRLARNLLNNLSKRTCEDFRAMEPLENQDRHDVQDMADKFTRLRVIPQSKIRPN